MMVSDSIVNASTPIASKDFGKKKRANRTAKLKQCKLDARRVQWLSQVKNKGSMEEVNRVAVGGGELNGSAIRTRKKDPVLIDLELQSDSESSHANTPTSSLSGGNDIVNNYSGSSSSSSFSSGGSFSGNVTEDEEEEGGGGCNDDDDGCLDDWEVMADALAATTANEKQGHNPDADLPPNNESGFGLGVTTEVTSHGQVDSQSERPKSEGVEKENRRAWRPDDASRPQSLPNLSKQRSFPANLERHSCHVVNPWVRCSIPTSCPICCEDLDLTDSNFLPCLCGFRLCLFCHKRILEEDGRCPGCRKPYAADTVEKEASVAGRSQTIRLARSCSMFPRV